MDELPSKQFAPVRLQLRTAGGNIAAVPGLLLVSPNAVLFYSQSQGQAKPLDLEASWPSLRGVETRAGRLIDSDSRDESSRSDGVTIELHFKDFRIWRLHFVSDTLASDCADTIVTYAAPRRPGERGVRDNVPAFHFVPPFDVPRLLNGWALTDDNGALSVAADLQRLLAATLPDVRARWTESSVNAHYEMCESYPARLWLPVSVASDRSVVRGAAGHRDHGRFAVLSWLHSLHGAALARSAQPLTGLSGRRSEADEALVRAMLESGGRSAAHGRILDARPFANAMANRALSGGYEDRSAYFGIDVEFLSLENIHALRDASARLRSTTSSGASGPWLGHVSSLLRGTVRLARLLTDGHSVLLHCSHGWDRTASLTSLAQLLLDAHYRSVRGLLQLIEKEWLAFGHQFSLRAAHVATRHALQTGTTHADAGEEAPVFVLWLDALWQLQRQLPSTFEWNERLLLVLADHYYAAQYGTLLGNSERERVLLRVRHDTASLWSLVLASPSAPTFLNPFWEPAARSAFNKGTLHEHIWTTVDKLSIWEALYARQDYVLSAPISWRLSDLARASLDKKDAEFASLRKEMAASKMSAGPTFVSSAALPNGNAKS